MSRYAKWAEKEHSDAARIAIMLLAGPVFLGLLPLVVAGVGPRLDRRLGLPSLKIGGVNCIVGGLLLVLGFSLGFWSVITQLTQGRGTPLPVMPTQERQVAADDAADRQSNGDCQLPHGRPSAELGCSVGIVYRVRQGGSSA